VSQNANIVQIDIEARALGRYFPVTLGIQADAKATADALIRAGESVTGNWQAWLQKFHQDKQQLNELRHQEATQPGTPMLPVRVLGEIRENLPRDAIVTVDTGNACLQAADRLAHYQSPGLVAPLDFGLVGFAYAAAIGAQAAARHRPVIAVMGDGGFGFTMTEMTTAVQYHLPVIAVVIDNQAWGAEKAYQKEFFEGRLLGAEISSPDYAALAELCGARGYRVDQPGDTAKALKQALADRKPAVIHVSVDPDALSALRKDLFKKK
ncbi:MAG: thiamine pyrophosphate-dependent enzyme, partial [Pseudomonadota bacterium]